MKHFGKLAVLGAVLAASTSFALADTITLASFGSAGNNVTNTAEASASNGQVNYVGYNATNPTGTLTTTGHGEAFDLNAGSTWVAPLGTGSLYTTNPVAGPDSNWVGATASAGPTNSQNTLNPVNTGYYTFTTTFSATGGFYSGNLDVMADDTLEVFLNNSSTPLVGFGGLGDDTHCAQFQPNCVNGDNITLSNITLLAGTNTLTFIVEQAPSGPFPGGNVASGFDFDGTLTQVTAPEPSSLMLLGTGLLGAAGMFYRRRQTV